MTLILEWLGGACPVQAEGFFANEPFYFRARGNSWTVYVGDSPFDNPTYVFGDEYGDEPFEAGCMAEEEALIFIYRSYNEYIAKTKNSVVSPKFKFLRSTSV